jgi:nitrous oxide reductase
MPREINQFRRRFLGSAAMTLAAGRLGRFDAVHAQSGTTTRAARQGRTRLSLR